MEQRCVVGRGTVEASLVDVPDGGHVECLDIADAVALRDAATRPLVRSIASEMVESLEKAKEQVRVRLQWRLCVHSGDVPHVRNTDMRRTASPTSVMRGYAKSRPKLMPLRPMPPCGKLPRSPRPCLPIRAASGDATRMNTSMDLMAPTMRSAWRSSEEEAPPTLPAASSRVKQASRGSRLVSSRPGNTFLI